MRKNSIVWQEVIAIILICISLIYLLIRIVIDSAPLSDNFDYSKELQLKKELADKGTWVISDQQGSRGPVEFADATDDYIYLGYAHMSTYVDAYDKNGEFVFSILFDDIQSGQFCVRCEDNYLFVMTRNGHLYIFDNTSQVGHLTKAEAYEAGYTHEWFRSKNYQIKIDEQSISKINSDGEKLLEIPLPKGVKVNPEFDLRPRIVVLVFVLVFLCFLAKNKKKDK